MLKNKSIPVNTIADQFDAGIAIERLIINTSEEALLNSSDEAKLAHREDRHSFFLLEHGTVIVEIDFHDFEIKAPSIIYMHPDQVHRILKLENMTVSVMAINNENLNPDYLKLLDRLTPAKPLALGQEIFSLMLDAVLFCTKFDKPNNDKLHHSILKDTCNAYAGLVISQYMSLEKTFDDTLTRFKLIANSFKSLLESNFISVKSPTTYAQKLNISTAYLNECVKNATGYPVSYHIQQRIILEAKRLLYHSDKSVKEISSELGYNDYPYFSKLFTKTTGMSALTFRNKNHE
jgi:AraC-like DNA-binding protein/mannose-6-phosphate isomerase-like protein (cupin superfamily)